MGHETKRIELACILAGPWRLPKERFHFTIFQWSPIEPSASKNSDSVGLVVDSDRQIMRVAQQG
jgi:hypothetical protein